MAGATVLSGGRKGKAAKRRVNNALIGLLSFGYFSFQ
jgi:hypothetical protein